MTLNEMFDKCTHMRTWISQNAHGWHEETRPTLDKEELKQVIREAIEHTRVKTQEVLSEESERRVVGFTIANLRRELGLVDNQTLQETDEAR